RFLTGAWNQIRKQIETNISTDTPTGELIEIGKSKETTSPLHIRLIGKCEMFSSLPFEDTPQYLEAVNEEYAFTLYRNNHPGVSSSIDDISYDIQKYRTKYQWKHGHLQGCILFFDKIYGRVPRCLSEIPLSPFPDFSFR
ncbi:MAG: hypothetical protein LBH00_08130, partial [Planctomycetaceae bacterium]|nr:hypothetical protein [Planctomycetaceae bacterium]